MGISLQLTGSQSHDGWRALPEGTNHQSAAMTSANDLPSVRERERESFFHFVFFFITFISVSGKLLIDSSTKMNPWREKKKRVREEETEELKWRTLHQRLTDRPQESRRPPEVKGHRTLEKPPPTDSLSSLLSAASSLPRSPHFFFYQVISGSENLHKQVNKWRTFWCR